MPTLAPTPSEPSPSAGYEQNSDGWGDTYEGHDVYISVEDRSDAPTLLSYQFYVNGAWVTGHYDHEVYDEQDPYEPAYTVSWERDVYYYFNERGDRVVYYTCNAVEM